MSIFARQKFVDMFRIFSPLLFSLFCLLFFQWLSCSEVQGDEKPLRQAQVQQVAKDFFQTFAERQDWEKFCSFYREDLIFDDIILQIHLDSLWKFKRFYKWDEEGGHFQKLSPDQAHITIDDLLVNDSVAVGRGRVNPFYYYGELIEPVWGMEATFWLYFDKDLKIKRQIDWIEYNPEVLESVVKRIREKGFHEVPDWLDLSKE